MLYLNEIQKAQLEKEIAAAKRWGFSKAYIPLEDKDNDLKNSGYEVFYVFDLNGKHIQTINRKKLPEYESGGCPVITGGERCARMN